MFHIGQEVVCIDASDSSGALVKGKVYVVKALTGHRGDREFILIHNPLNPTADGGWLRTRFRPVLHQSTKAGFEVLDRIRRKAGRKVEVTQ